MNTTADTAVSRRAALGRPSITQNIRAAFSRWQERSRVRFELQQMNIRELSDLGLNPSDIDDVADGTYRRGE
jgi:uncharacterized protein YjiS (DUF1127 family)